MKTPELPTNDPARVGALHSYKILDTGFEERFDELTRLVAAIFDAPIALISLVDTDRLWFKSRYGLDLAEAQRDISFCGHVVADEAAVIVPDATEDARFADNPFVVGALHVRFYAGAPLVTPDGFVLGALFARVLAFAPDMGARFVFVTGGALEGRAQTFLANVPNEHVDKPFNLQTLRAIARRFADARAGS
jgi:hypothetical protein